MEPSLHNKIFSSTGCLSEEQLLKYSSNTLAPKEKHKVEKHLLECELCSDAIEGFITAPAAAEVQEIRSQVQQITSQGRTISPNYWKRFLLAASVIGIAFISFYFFFQQNKMAEKKMLAEKMETEQVQPLEDRLSPEETATEPLYKRKEPELKKSIVPAGKSEKLNREVTIPEGGTKMRQTITSDNLAEGKNGIAQENSITADAEMAAAIIPDKTATGQDEYMGDLPAEEKKEEEKPMLLEKTARAKNDETDSKTQPATKALEEDYSKNYRAESGNRSGALFIAGREKKAPSKSTAPASVEIATSSESSNVKYIDNLKVIDYSEKYAAFSSDQDKIAGETGIPAQFESIEKAKEAESAQQAQTINLSYETILREGLSALETKNYLSALEKFNLILKNFPDDLNAIFYSGLAYYNLGNFDKALANFNLVTASRNAFNDEGNWYTALTYQKKNEKEKARLLFREISKTDNFYQKKAADMLKETDK